MNTQLHWLLPLLLALALNDASATNWSSCAESLTQASLAATTASEYATTAKNRSEDYENCKRSPAVYDRNRDDCYLMATQDDFAAMQVRTSIELLAMKLKSVNLSCDLSAPIVKKTPREPSERCTYYRKSKGKMEPEMLQKFCQMTLSESECRRCLSH